MVPGRGQQTLDLTSSGGAHLEATLATQQVSGTITFGGQAHSFTATPATGQAGLYRADQTINGQEYLGGWDVLQDGRVEGQVRSGTTPVPASPFHPGGSVTLPGVGTLTPQFIENTTTE
jgi:hypothetical protein